VPARCPLRDYVKKVAVYKDRVAVQLPARVVLYQLEDGAGELDMQYRASAKINRTLECNLLVVTSAHIVLCQVGARSAGQRSVAWRGGASNSVGCTLCMRAPS
jgi:hypothetical protein